jgi:hypothetical protein
MAPIEEAALFPKAEQRWTMRAIRMQTANNWIPKDTLEKTSFKNISPTELIIRSISKSGSRFIKSSIISRTVRPDSPKGSPFPASSSRASKSMASSCSFIMFL